MYFLTIIKVWIEKYKYWFVRHHTHAHTHTHTHTHTNTHTHTIN